MSGKSRYDEGTSSVSRYDNLAEKTRSTAPATLATDAAVQASWATYVQNLVSEQIAAIHDGVIDGLREGINDQLDRLYDETNKFLRRELDCNSAKLESVVADI